MLNSIEILKKSFDSKIQSLEDEILILELKEERKDNIKQIMFLQNLIHHLLQIKTDFVINFHLEKLREKEL